MGTHCFICIEDPSNHTVRSIYVHYDGYFSHIIPVLRKHYMTREQVEHLMSLGDQSILDDPSKLSIKTGDPCEKWSNRYEMETFARTYVHYWYVFAGNDKWECQSSDMFGIDELKY